MLDDSRDTRGQNLIEFALIFPLLMLLLLGIMEFGIVVFVRDNVASVAREGVRYGIVHPDDTAGIIAAAQAASAGLDPDALTINAARAEDTVQVQVVYVHNLLTAPMIRAVGGSSTLTLSTVATMRIER